MKNTDTTGYVRLAAVLSRRTAEQAKQPLVVDFGVIMSNKALKTNAFPVPIPAKAYLVCARAVYRIHPGDRVVVLWSGSDAIVLDKMVPGSSIT